jgi:hypothetical protein
MDLDIHSPSGDATAVVAFSGLAWLSTLARNRADERHGVLDGGATACQTCTDVRLGARKREI